MTIFTDGPSFRPQQGIGSLGVDQLEQVRAEGANTFAESPTSQLLGMKELGTALGTSYDIQDPMGNVPADQYPHAAPPSAPGEDVPMDQAKARVKDRGLSLNLPDQATIKGPALDIMMQWAQDRREREATIARGPGGFVSGALSVGTSFLVGAVDPLNVASAFIPVMGEMRYAKLLADAGEAAGARAGVRAMVGGAQGAVGMAALQPLDWAAHSQDGQDFGMADALRNVMFGAALGGALHPIGGVVSDRFRTAKERPLYPYDLGEPLESHTPWSELQAKPAAAPDILGEFPGIPAEVKPATKVETAPKPEPTPVVAALNDLPPRAKEDAMRAAVAALHAGEPVQVGEMLEAAAKTDPRIAESLAVATPEGPKKKGRAGADPQTWSLFEYLASRGGIAPDPEVTAIFGKKGPFIPGFGPLIRKNGRTLEDALTLAKEGSYMFDPNDLAHLGHDATRPAAGELTLSRNDLLNLLDNESRGQKNYRNDHTPQVKIDPAREEYEIRRRVEGQIEAHGETADPKLIDRTIQIMQKEGETNVHSAYERAIMEDAERYEATRNARQVHPEAGNIPGWDVPHDPNAAPGDGLGGALDIGQEGRPLEGARQADGSQSRGYGAADREADWKKLSQAKPEFDEPNVIELSKSAEKLPDPAKSTTDERLSAAEKADAYAKQMFDMFAARLPEEERALLDEKLKQLSQGQKDREDAVKLGASCMYGKGG